MAGVAFAIPLSLFLWIAIPLLAYVIHVHVWYMRSATPTLTF